MEGRKHLEPNEVFENDLRDFIKNNISKSNRQAHENLQSKNNFIIHEDSIENSTKISKQSLANATDPFTRGFNYQHAANKKPKQKLKKKDNFNNESSPIMVAVRIRPFMEREAIKGKFVSAVEPHQNKEILTAYEYFNLEAVPGEELEKYVNQSQHYNPHQFVFDKVFGLEIGQQEVYETVAKPVVMNIFNGFNGSILAYGQTGTGKTHTMEGFVFRADPSQVGKSSLAL